MQTSLTLWIRKMVLLSFSQFDLKVLYYISLSDDVNFYWLIIWFWLSCDFMLFLKYISGYSLIHGINFIWSYWPPHIRIDPGGFTACCLLKCCMFIRNQHSDSAMTWTIFIDRLIILMAADFWSCGLTCFCDNIEMQVVLCTNNDPFYRHFKNRYHYRTIHICIAMQEKNSIKINFPNRTSLEYFIWN